jgi:cytochrome c oxidase subunit 3
MSVGYTQKERAALAMTVTLVSFAMLFASLFLMYMVYRVSNTVWPPMGFDKISLEIPTLSTLIILLSSVTFWKFQKAYQEGKQSKGFYYLTLVLSLGFLASQKALWSQMNLEGVYVESGVFASILHSFTWIHAAHVLLAILTLFYCYPVVKTTDSKKYELRVLNTGKFWHFLGLVWVIMFLGLFVL